MSIFLFIPEITRKRINELRDIADIISYSYKTNPFIGDYIIKNTDLLISINNLKTYKKLKEINNRIIYFVQGEKKEELNQINPKYWVVDNINDYKKIKDKNNIILRIKLREHSIQTSKFFVFGLRKEYWQKLLNKNNIIGVHFHKKTQNIGEWDLISEIDDLFSKYLEKIRYIDIGGGIPWKYINSNPPIKKILNKIKELRKYLNEYNIKLIIEPGRFIAAPSIILETEILNIYENTIIVNASLFNAFLDSYLLNIRLPVLGEGEGEFYYIKGNTPDSLDLFRYQTAIKPKKEKYLFFLNIGAYNFHCNFNELEKIKYKEIANTKELEKYLENKTNLNKNKIKEDLEKWIY